MVKATIRQMHVPQACKCQSHNKGVYTCCDSEHEFISHKVMTETLARWTVVQGENACWVYSIVKVS